MMQDWFKEPGAYVLVDGQFGSTGKGVMAGILADIGKSRITHVTTNAGPNSGHTAFISRAYPAPIVTRQLPVASVFLNHFEQFHVTTVLNAGAVIDKTILRAETAAWLAGSRLQVSRGAAVIGFSDREQDKAAEAAIAGTGKGVGPAIARKVMRQGPLEELHGYERWYDGDWDWDRHVVLVETAQGFSLGLNTWEFYPHVTSRECTVMQAISDARIPAQMVRKVVACYRTFPIRVGNTAGSSGDCYYDQEETSWEELGLTPELTTVTKRVRRVFTWSRQQFLASVQANRPDAIFLNFCNYLRQDELRRLLDMIQDDYYAQMGGQTPEILLGFGPYCEDVHDFHDWSADMCRG